MLKILFGNIKDEIYHIDSFFDYEYEDNWIINDISKQIIKDIDNSEVINESNIKSPVLGIIHPTKLSGGCKALIYMNMDNSLSIDVTQCGENCSDWIIRLAQDKDIIISLSYFLPFDNFEKIFIINSNKFVYNRGEYFKEYINNIEDIRNNKVFDLNINKVDFDVFDDFDDFDD